MESRGRSEVHPPFETLYLLRAHTVVALYHLLLWCAEQKSSLSYSCLICERHPRPEAESALLADKHRKAIYIIPRLYFATQKQLTLDFRLCVKLKKSSVKRPVRRLQHSALIIPEKTLDKCILPTLSTQIICHQIWLVLLFCRKKTWSWCVTCCW